jgi:hypothetical protein
MLEQLSDGRHVLSTRTQNRIDSMQRTLSNLPGATMAEAVAFLAGWDEGEKWRWANPDHPDISYKRLSGAIY